MRFIPRRRADIARPAVWHGGLSANHVALDNSASLDGI